MNAAPTGSHLVQMLLPLYDNGGQPLDTGLFAQVFDELTHRFGGVTAYQHAPADGAWKQAGSGVQHDQVVIFEVMVKQLDRSWWQGYRCRLEERFRQEKLLLRAIAVEEL